MPSHFLFFSVVGMKYHGNHEFSQYDENNIKLEKDPNNIYDKNAIKVLIATHLEKHGSVIMS